MFRYSFLILLFLFPVSSYSNWQGTGTSSAPYEIWTLDDLNALADSINTRNFYGRNLHFKLMADIDTFKNVIGHNNPTILHRWNHHFDGNGHTITVAIYGRGLFGFADKNSVIRNLNIDGVVSGLSEVGGFVGTNFGLIQNCTNYASVYATEWSGAIVGFNIGTVIGCHNYGTMTSNSFYIGGIVGVNNEHILECVNAGYVIGGNDVGGIVGRISSFAQSSVTIEYVTANNLNIGSVEGGNRIGGIVGDILMNNNLFVLVSNNTNSGFIKGDNSVGGIIGRVFNNTTISNNFNSGVVQSNLQNVGCIIGLKGISANITITNNHYDKQMCGEED